MKEAFDTNGGHVHSAGLTLFLTRTINNPPIGFPRHLSCLSRVTIERAELLMQCSSLWDSLAVEARSGSGRSPTCA